MNDTQKCTECGESLNSKEMITREIYGDAICDICMGKQKRIEMAKTNYGNLLQSVPAIYAETKFTDKFLQEYIGKSAVILAEESPIAGSQWAWDTIRLYWKLGYPATHISARDAAIEYGSIPWQQKKDHIDYYVDTPGLLVIDDIDYDAPRELLSRVVEHRAERNRYTLIVIHVPYEDIDKAIGDKAEALVKAKWGCMAMERK